jgi:hypothetical protein
MGTRADFYVGRGPSAEWLGSIAWDGYRDGIPDAIILASTEADFRREVAAFLASRDDGTTPDLGWPWPWEDSHTTDCTYSFDPVGQPLYPGADTSSVWWESHTDPNDWRSPKCWTNEAGATDTSTPIAYPNMKDRQRVTFGKRSGVIFVR